MIAVIADDFTGAAELAGIGLRYGLKIQVAKPGITCEGADLFVVSTDSRSLNKQDAMKITGETVEEIMKLHPEFIFKKIDSVLRGHVLDELKVQMQITGLKRALVISANPSLGRTIKDGHYFIDGREIHKTGFATDPEFAITDSSVLKMIRSEGQVRILGNNDNLPETGVFIGEAETERDIITWANKAGHDTLLIGAVDFFAALLNRKFLRTQKAPAVFETPHLFVSGTSFDKSRSLIKKIKEESACVVYMDEAMMKHEQDIDEDWIKSVKNILNTKKKCVIAIAENISPDISALHLRTIMAKVVKKIVRETGIKELFIEGGSTAAAILNELNIVSLTPVNELQKGVVRMHAGELFITMKPGSYNLPEQIRELYLLK